MLSLSLIVCDPVLASFVENDKFLLELLLLLLVLTVFFVDKTT